MRVAFLSVFVICTYVLLPRGLWLFEVRGCTFCLKVLRSSAVFVLFCFSLTFLFTISDFLEFA